MKIFQVSHIDIDLHWTFLLLLAFVLLAGGIDSAIIMLVLFGSVVLHELSHSIVAKMHGIRVRRIILLPIGGMSMIEEFAMPPATELKVAVAGPIFSFFLALVSLAVLALTSNFDVLLPITNIAAAAVEANVMLGAFNLLPAIPLDGGRVWRALRQRHRDYLTATREAVSLSKLIVVLLFIGSFAAAFLFSEWAFLFWNAIVALFIFVGSDMELDGAIFKTASDGLFVRDVMRPKPVTISGEKSLRDAIILALSTRSTSFILTGKGVTPAVISIGPLEKIPQSGWKGRKLSSLHPIHVHVSPETPAIEAWKRMRTAGAELSPVLANGKLVGAVYGADIERLIYLKKIALVS